MFNTRYSLLGVDLVCDILHTKSTFRLEKDSYDFLKRITTNAGYKYSRIETIGQDGFPDVLIMKQDEYCMIEAKRLKKKRLVRLEDDLEWQFGQIGFAVRALTTGLNYVLVVCKDSTLAIIGQEQTLCRLKHNQIY